MSLVLISLALALKPAPMEGQMTEPHLMRFPTVYGDRLAFTYAGDLWIARTSGGVARRLTSHPGLETRPHFSADGRTIAFTGSYEGPANIYTIPVEGGEPTRLTYDAETDTCEGFAPDGNIAYTSTHGNFTNRQPRLWYVKSTGGLPIKTAIDEAGEVSFFPDGKTIAYNRINSWGFNWRHYRGGSQGFISTYNFPENKYVELPHGREQSYFPMVVGRSIYYISDKTLSTQNLYRYDLDTKHETQLTKYTDADVRTPSTDGKTISFEREGLVYLYDIASGQVRKPEIRILSENLATRPVLKNLSSSIESATLSPTGARLIMEARGELFSVPAKQGDVRNLTNTSASRERFPQWSPDGKTVAYVSDATGNYELYTRPQLGGTPVQLTFNTPGTIVALTWSPSGKYIQFQKQDSSLWFFEVATKKVTHVTDAPYSLGGTDWSPDERWIAFIRAEKNLQGALYFYEVATGKTTPADSGYYDDTDVSFDRNGKYVYLASNREFALKSQRAVFAPFAEATSKLYVIPLQKTTPNPLTIPNDEEPDTTAVKPVASPTPNSSVQIDFEGIKDRVLELPVSGGSFQNIVGSTNGVFYLSNSVLHRFDINSREDAPIIGGVQNVIFNRDQSKLAYFGGPTIGVIDVHPGGAVGQGRVDTSGVQAIIDPRAEWKQIFWEAWRFERDHYYDEKYRGLDWNAIGKRYATYLPDVNSRLDLNYVLGLMISEFGTSHSYVSGGDIGNTGSPIPLSYLGADYESVNGKIRIAKVLQGHSFEEAERSPLQEPGVDVHAGDYLLEIDGRPLSADANPDSYLLGKAGRYVVLTVSSSPTGSNPRKVRVRPLATEANLRYWDFADNNAREVDRLSNGRIGYVHVRDTGATGTVDLYRGFYPQTDKDSLIVDERWNGGGNLPGAFVELLARRYQTALQRRSGADVGDAFAIEGPKAMLINGYAGSGGDMFPWLFKKQNVGPLIGKRTWGGLVGINAGAPLVDGGSVTAPEFAIFDRETGEIIAENHGVNPDIDVDRRPDLVAQGKDPQLEAAVNYLLDQLRRNPPKPPRKEMPRLGKEGIGAP